MRECWTDNRQASARLSCVARENEFLSDTSQAVNMSKIPPHTVVLVKLIYPTLMLMNPRVNVLLDEFCVGPFEFRSQPKALF